MNFLAEHIEKLLITNDCVVVGSLGGFIKNKKNASIVGDRIVPPMVEISFNSMLLHNDGLLCSLISEESGISYKSALSVLNRHVEEFRKKLVTEKYVELGNIGTFSYVDDIMLFSPYEAEYLPENFGLRPIEVRERRRVQKIGETIELDNDRITINVSDIRQKVVRYAAIVAVIISVAIFMPKASNTAQYAGFVAGNTAVLFEDRCKKSDKALADFAQTIDKTFVYTDSPTSDLESVIEPPKSYHVVVASFGLESQAEEFCNENSANLGNITILKSKDNPAKYRCITGSFATQEEAYANKPSQKVSWVLCQKQ